MSARPVLLADDDHVRLAAFLSSLKPKGLHQALVLYSLENVLQQALVVPREELPADVVRMDCRVRLQEVPVGREISLLLVFPWEADPPAGKMSVLSSTGTAILGRRVGEVVDCPGAPRRMRYLIRGLAPSELPAQTGRQRRG